MPELPEVETVRRTLLTRVRFKTISNIEIYYPKIFVIPTVEEVKEKIKHQTIIDIDRKGKWLIFELNDYYLLSHLRMEGKYSYHKFGDIHEKHELVSFVLNDMELRYKDVRKFGKMYLVTKDKLYTDTPLANLGLEPWDEDLNIKYLKTKILNKKIPIKTLLLDQSIITGIGNIYADEILFLSKINPNKKSNLLNDIELNDIIINTKNVLSKAIEDGGTTIRSYTSDDGVFGRHQNNLFVHSRENEECRVCKTKINKIRINGRGTYYCPNCQK